MAETVLLALGQASSTLPALLSIRMTGFLPEEAVATALSKDRPASWTEFLS